MTIIEAAARLAVRGHKEQIRKDDEGSPYVVHPMMVAFILQTYGFSDVVIAAAFAHDLLEDTDISADELKAAIGEEAFAIVTAVTNDDSLSWEEKKVKYIESVRLASEGARAVATADKIHNAESLIAAHARLGPALWQKFSAGKEKKLWFEEAMLTMLQETWEHPLVDRYGKLVAQMRTLD